MHTILRGFFFFHVIFVSRLSIYHEIAWPNLQHKTNAALQNCAAKTGHLDNHFQVGRDIFLSDKLLGLQQ